MHVGGGGNGVKSFGAQEELITSLSNLRVLQAGGCSLVETNKHGMESKRYECRLNTEALLRKTCGAVNRVYHLCRNSGGHLFQARWNSDCSSGKVE
jgi:hypothetical protein